MNLRSFVSRVGQIGGFAELLHSPRSGRGQLALGRALLLACGAVVCSTIWSLSPNAATAAVMVAVSAALLAVVFFSPRLPWTDAPSRYALIFPLSVLGGLTGLRFADATAAAPYAGLIVLCFVYVGLTQKPGTSLALAPVAAAVWLSAQGGWKATVAIRLGIALMIWVSIGELLSFRSEMAARDRLILSRFAHTDSLTGLVNRRALDDRLARATAGDTVVMCDLDHFKALNDRLGHAAGDQVLARFGGLLSAGLRGADTAGRYGGEEFVLVLAETSPEAALDVLARMRSRWAVIQPGVTFSSGIADVTEGRRSRRRWPLPTRRSTRPRPRAATATTSTTGTSFAPASQAGASH